MICARCKRPMQKPAVTITSRSGAQVLGPKCARIAGLLEPVQRTRAPVFSRPGEADAAQMVLELSA